MSNKKTTIENVGVIDLRSATEKSISDIDCVKNAGVALVSKETAHLASKIRFENLGVTVEVPSNYQIHQGQMVLSHQDLATIKKPLRMAIMGQLIVSGNVQPEDIEHGIEGLIVVGQILSPESSISAIQSKLIHLSGQLMPLSANIRMFTGVLDLNNHFINALNEESSLLVVGKLNITEELDVALFDKKIRNVTLMGIATVREEYMDVFNKKLLGIDGDVPLMIAGSQINVIPAGYQIVERDLTIDSTTIKKFDNTKISARNIIQFSKNVMPESVEKAIAAIHTDKVVMCPESLYEAVTRICDKPETKILTYKNGYKILSESYTLTQSELEYMEKPCSIMVKGNLLIDNGVIGTTFSEKIEHVDNYGVITTNPEQLGAVQSKIRTQKGIVIHEQNNDNDKIVTKNAGIIKL